MAEILTYVYINLDGEDIPVGRLWSYFNNGKESASFKYDESWLKFPRNFELEPYLPLTEGTGHTDNKKKHFCLNVRLFSGYLGTSADKKK